MARLDCEFEIVGLVAASIAEAFGMRWRRKARPKGANLKSAFEMPILPITNLSAITQRVDHPTEAANWRLNRRPQRASNASELTGHRSSEITIFFHDALVAQMSNPHRAPLSGRRITRVVPKSHENQEWSMDLALLWLQLLGSAIIILGAANYMAKAADVVALKTGLGRTFIGVVLLATATSLPELGTGVSSITLFGEPDLAVGDAFGSNIFNLLIIGLLDLSWRKGPILSRVDISTAAVGMLGISVISIAALAIVIHGLDASLFEGYISPLSLVLFVVFMGAMYLIYRFEQNGDSNGSDESYASDSLSRAFFTYSLSALIVVAASVWLAKTGDTLAEAMGWEASFVGTQFLAFSTSLPELAASFAAIRINAPELAISNVLGSNLFNMGFILSMDELAYTNGTLWAVVSPIHVVTAVIAILMTSVVLVAIALGTRDRPSRFFTLESLILIGLYIVTSVLVFYFS
ncbi:MAG: hypothetical protein ETSY1_25290 [Candidatus Entotheonella factor]|uniref:Sodium/calcium exchanger membrane region domain-containing protein n=1 Tax=Entotheonella factor TaxID=1429438 RepID=W4LFJ3_ENTF1|nr:MAG: hypothetical protein ETSY1_25290 [Candidatus Entotheonella factor]